MAVNYPTDVVITWLDADDPAWQNLRKQYPNSDLEASGPVRYRDWGFLCYLFRGIEKYMPWVNRIFFVTYGHVPAWLNTDHPKLTVVSHEDFVPYEYLPAFSIRPIEMNFHRIEGLSEQFIYFNDDMFVLKKTKPEDFFVDGKPVDTFAWNAVSVKPENSMTEHVILNDLELIAGYTDKKSVQKKQWKALLSPKNGSRAFKSLLLFPWKSYTGIENPHQAQPHLKSTFARLWELEPEKLDSTCRHRYRSREDINQWAARYWNLVHGQYVLKRRTHELYYQLQDHNPDLIRRMQEGKISLLCLAENPDIKDVHAAAEEICSVFEKLFPERSSFEKDSEV
ncbi:MAG: hypothetical protein IJJ29_09835 [Solobacterium sp.]|nr:hypothetical protein [Solobacterium sp.]